MNGKRAPQLTPAHPRDGREEWLTTLFAALVLLILAGAVSLVVSLV